MITTTEKQQVRQLLQDPKWKAVENIAEALISKIKDDTVLRNTEWDTIKEAVLQSGRIEGIRNFIQELYIQAQQ